MFNAYGLNAFLLQVGRMMAEMVRMEHLEKHFGDFEVLRDINLTVGEGEKLAIIGPSGSGKPIWRLPRSTRRW